MVGATIFPTLPVSCCNRLLTPPGLSGHRFLDSQRVKLRQSDILVADGRTPTVRAAVIVGAHCCLICLRERTSNVADQEGSAARFTAQLDVVFLAGLREQREVDMPEAEQSL